MKTNIFDRDFWLDWHNWGVSVKVAQECLDCCHEDVLPWLEIWPRNIERNLCDHLPQAEDWISWEYGSCEGPVLICGAGPSLSANAEDVKRIAQERDVPIICVDRALRTLKENDIEPCMIVAADAQARVRGFFDDYLGEGDLVAISIVCDPSVVNHVKSKSNLLFYGSLNPFSGFWRMMYKQHGEHIANVRSGSVVTFNAVDIALWMGFNPIMTIGNELSFKDAEEAGLYLKGQPEPELLKKHQPSGRWTIKAFADAAANFGVFPHFHDDIQFIDLSGGLLKYYGWLDCRIDFIKNGGNETWQQQPLSQAV